MTKSSNLESIEKATGKTWGAWVKLLDAAKGRELAHSKIADLVAAELAGKVDNPGWWAQGVAVAYEQHIGRRQPGQRSDGSFEISINKNLGGSRADIFARVIEWANAKPDFNGHHFDNVRTSETPLRSYWRCNLDDGTKVELAVGPRSGDNYMLTVAHTKLASSAVADTWRSYWKDEVQSL